MVGRSVHDPVHGTIPVAAGELAVIDSPAVQRLRFVKQLGFAEMAFPGATHSRLAHSVGAMHMAGRMFDEATAALPLTATQRPALRLALRLAVLLHDLGHPPLSHASEAGMPAVSRLELGAWAPGPPTRRACHEDYTIRLIVDSPLAALLRLHVGDSGVTPELVAMLVAGFRPAGVAVDEALTRCEGQSLWPLLWGMVSGELDADRMDYLRRDAHFVGVSYGNFDHLWLTANMVALPGDEGWMLGLTPRAIWALENFLLARYHMFLAVYHHHTAVAFDTMLAAWFAEVGFTWPADPEAFLACDDISFWHGLRASPSRWARDLVGRRPLALLEEAHLWDEDDAVARAAAIENGARALRDAGLGPLRVRSDSLLSRYGRPGGRGVPLVMQAATGASAQPVDASTPLYRRFAQTVHIERLFIPAEQRAAAREVLASRRARRPAGGDGGAGL